MLIPTEVLQETIDSLDLLFPRWNSDTVKLLEKHNQVFHDLGPIKSKSSRTSKLLAFDHWRARLQELHDEIFLSPPVSWAQLWRDRRSPQQFWTFWIALLILVLTLASTGAAFAQTWASLQALKSSNGSAQQTASVSGRPRN